jgi:hypothetical protein
MDINHEHDYNAHMLRIPDLVTVRNFVVTYGKYNTVGIHILKIMHING